MVASVTTGNSPGARIVVRPQGWQGRSGALTSAPRPAPPGEISAPRPAPPSAPAQVTTPGSPRGRAAALAPGPPGPALSPLCSLRSPLLLNCLRKQLLLRTLGRRRARRDGRVRRSLGRSLAGPLVHCARLSG